MKPVAHPRQNVVEFQRDIIACCYKTVFDHLAILAKEVLGVVVEIGGWGPGLVKNRKGES
jgi:hypothetical protein